MESIVTLESLGFDAGLEELVRASVGDGLSPARVFTVNRDSYRIYGKSGEAVATATGKLLFGADSALELPGVGDWVVCQFYDDDSAAVIHEVLPRKTVLKRKSPGKTVDYQLIAANIDVAFVVQSLDSNFNLNRLDRYLVMIREGGIEPHAVLTKSDLIEPGEITKSISGITDRQDVPVHVLSNLSGDGIDQFKDVLQPAKTYCLVGSSGVGKSTLLNRLAGSGIQATAAVRENDQRGRHTTSRRDLLVLPGGAMIIDTPGMRELANFGIESGLEESFDDIAALAAGCRFKDCSHTVETGCAVLEALEDGSLAEESYRSWLKLKKESDYLSRSYLEKRRRDKKFGRMVKDIMKNKKHRR